MRLLSRMIFAACASVFFVAPVSACGMFPFDGWWGAGYYGSPGYASYPSYTNYSAPPSYGCCGTAAPVYSASYGSSCGSGCCVSSCCDPCGSGCASGSCAGSVPAGSLKPAQDPISDKPATDYDDDARSRRFDADSPRPRTRDTSDPLLDDLDQKDQFSSPKSDSGTGAGAKSDPGYFDSTPNPAEDQLHNKPPISDPAGSESIPPVEPDPSKPVDEKTFFDGSTTNPGNTTSRLLDTVLARSSSLSEVIAPKRLATRSLPSVHRTVSSSTLANKLDSDKTDTQRPLRWISAPLPTGNIRL